jgi:hypothetical protein
VSENPSTSSLTRTVIVALPEGTRADWLTITQILTWLKLPASVPHQAFLVRRSGLLAWFTCWFTTALIEPVRHAGAVQRAAGGRRSRLDLHRQATIARNLATHHWWTWNQHIARTTQPARTWQEYLQDVNIPAKKLTEDHVRTQFEAQPRVMAMLANNSYPAASHHFDPYRLEEYQAGEAVYVALHWQHDLTGDALVTPEGRLLEPASSSIPDRLRYLAEATRIVHTLAPQQHLVAVKAAPAP